MATTKSDERWRGEVDTKLDNITRTLEMLTKSLEKNDTCGQREHEELYKRLNALEVNSAVSNTKLTAFVSVASIVGAGVVTAALRLIAPH